MINQRLADRHNTSPQWNGFRLQSGECEDREGVVNFDFERTVNINGTIVLDQSGSCVYRVRPNGRGTVRCVVSTPGLPDTEETFAFTIIDRAQVDFVSTTPGSVVRGEARKQKRSAGY